jgi:monovalent cation:H+ antiporter-2, CPA2 family
MEMGLPIYLGYFSRPWYGISPFLQAKEVVLAREPPMHMDPGMPALTGTALVIVIIAMLLKKFRQPYVVAYMVAGIVLGPHVFALVTDAALLNRIGAFGVILLLFFVGMEVSLPNLVKNWRIVIIGTLLQVLISILCIWALGFWLNWPIARIVLLGFVISLSSTAVIIKMLHDGKEADSLVGQNVIGILLVQDFLVIPMLITINFMGGSHPSFSEIMLQVIGAIVIFGILAWIVMKKAISLPFAKYLKYDYELQVFFAFLICLGMASLTGLLGLSAALGAFVAGIIVAAAKETDWVQNSLESFRGIFVALFFVSIGMTVDLQFLINTWTVVLVLMVATLLTNTFINAGILRLLQVDFKEAFYAGALLSQIGEFSFVLAAVGFQAGIINDFGYQATIATIFATLLVSPLWIALVKTAVANNDPRSEVA